jgi:hypothetical protein
MKTNHARHEAERARVRHDLQSGRALPPAPVRAALTGSGER